MMQRYGEVFVDSDQVDSLFIDIDGDFDFCALESDENCIEMNYFWRI